jgi:hypothetical protein
MSFGSNDGSVIVVTPEPQSLTPVTTRFSVHFDCKNFSPLQILEESGPFHDSEQDIGQSPLSSHV